MSKGICGPGFYTSGPGPGRLWSPLGAPPTREKKRRKRRTTTRFWTGWAFFDRSISFFFHIVWSPFLGAGNSFFFSSYGKGGYPPPPPPSPPLKNFPVTAIRLGDWAVGRLGERGSKDRVDGHSGRQIFDRFPLSQQGWLQVQRTERTSDRYPCHSKFGFKFKQSNEWANMRWIFLYHNKISFRFKRSGDGFSLITTR